MKGREWNGLVRMIDLLLASASGELLIIPTQIVSAVAGSKQVAISAKSKLRTIGEYFVPVDSLANSQIFFFLPAYVAMLLAIVYK